MCGTGTWAVIIEKQGKQVAERRSLRPAAGQPQSRRREAQRGKSAVIGAETQNVLSSIAPICHRFPAARPDIGCKRLREKNLLSSTMI